MKSTTSSNSSSQRQSSSNMSMSMYKQGQQTPLTIDEIKPNNPVASRRRRQNFQGMATFYVPLLADTINKFFQATTTMEEEILLPSRLKDLPLEELIFDTSIQPDNWHELYSFLREIRNQLTERSIFSDVGKQREPPIEAKPEGDPIAEAKPQPEPPVEIPKQEEEEKRERPVFVAAEESQASCSGSIISSLESDQSASSTDSTSYQTIKDEIKYHYCGFLASLTSLASIAERVTEKYREKFDF